MKTLIITNNPKVNIEFSNKYNNEEIDFRPDAGQQDILRAARDLIHLGARLVMHPMMGRIKPHETPYKSVFLEVPDEPCELDTESLIIIEDSISETEKYLNNTFMKKYDDSLLPDLQYIDLLLLKTGMEEYRR